MVGAVMAMKRLVARVCFAFCLGLLVSCAGSPPPVSESSGSSAASYGQTPDGFYRVRRGDSLHAIAFKFSLDWREIARLNGISSPYTIYPDQMLRLGAIPPTVTDTQPAAEGAVRTAAIPAPSATSTRPLETPGSSSNAVEPVENTVEAPVAGPETETVATAGGRPDASRESDSTPSQSQPGPGNPSAGAVRAPEMSVPTTAAGDPARWLWPTEGRLISTFRADDASRKGIDIGGRKGQPVIATAPGLVVYSGSGLIGYGELIIIKHSDRMLSAYAHNSKRLVSEGAKVGAGSQIAEMGSNDRNQALLHFEIRVNGSPQDPLKYLPRR